jgi:hypothetical protein
MFFPAPFSLFVEGRPDSEIEAATWACRRSGQMVPMKITSAEPRVTLPSTTLLHPIVPC